MRGELIMNTQAMKKFGLILLPLLAATGAEAAPNSAVVGLGAATVMVSEGAGTVSIVVSSNVPAKAAIDIPFTVGGTAVNPLDHDIPASGRIVIPAGATSAKAVFHIVDDDRYEDSKTIEITLGRPSTKGPRPSLGAISKQVITIADNDLPPTVGFSVAAQSIGEASGTATATLQLSAASGKDVVVPYVVSGTASSPDDHDLVSGSVTIPSGATTANLSIKIVDDGVYEGNETVVVTLGKPTDATLGANTVHTLTILDSSAAPTVAWSAAAQTAAEDAGKVSLTAKLSGASNADVVVPFTVAGTAKNPDDHDLAAGSITIAAGKTEASVSFNVKDDDLVEGDETVIATLGAPTGATLGSIPVHTVTIADNDVAVHPVVAWSAAFQTVDEGAGVVTVTAKLDKAGDAAITVPFIVTGTAKAPADHDLVDSSITIAAGSLMASKTFSLVDDALYEADETIILSMGKPTNATLGTPAVHTVTVKNNDLAPVISFSVAAQSVGEGAGTVTVTAKLDKASGVAASSTFTVAGTAVSPDDHNLSAGSVVIPAGSTTKAITFSLVDDAVYEQDETVSIALLQATDATIGAPSTHVVTVTDNETAPLVNFKLAAQTIEEAAGTATVEVTLDKTSSKNISVPFKVSGTATNPGDHNLADGAVAIAAGQTSGKVTFDIVKDAVAENDETVILTLSAPTGAVLGTVATHTLTITEKVANPTVQWQLANQAVSEAVGTAKITATLNAMSANDVVVPFTVSGTSASPADHNLAAGSVKIPAGSLSADVSVAIVDDTIDENNETLVVTMGTPTGAVLGATTVHTLTINDNDNAPVVQFKLASQAVAESVGTVTVAVGLSAASGLDVTVPFTVAGTAANPADHNLAAGSVKIAAGQTSANVTFTVVDDAIFENAETVILNLGAPTNATLGTTVAHTVTINDNETAPTIQWSVAAQSVTEAVGTVTVQATLSGATSSDTTAPFTVSGTAANPGDHNLASGSVKIVAGQTTANVTFTVVNDAVAENDETVILTMGNPAPSTVTLGTRTVHTVTITDNDVASVVQFAAAAQSVSEAVGNATVTVSLDKASGADVVVPFTVSGTATNPADHGLAAGSVTIAAGTLSKAITVPIVNDAVVENDETIILTMGTPTGATAGTTKVHTLTITDNDVAPTVQWSLASQSVGEGAGSVTLTATLSAASGAAVSVPVTVAATSTAKVTDDYTVASTKLDFPAGTTSVAYTVAIVNDTANEDAETVTFVLGMPTGATLGTITSHALTITDNDPAPMIQWSLAKQEAKENDGSATLVASLSAASSKDVTVSFAVGGNANNAGANRMKVNLAAGSLTIAAGQTTKNLVAPLVNDSLAGPSDFYFTVTMQTATNATVGATALDTVTILDEDLGATSSQEGYRTTVWPLTRQRCIGCHGASGFLPNHASDTLQIAHDAAVPLVDFANIPNARLVLKSADGHCGAYCLDNGLATDTKPLMIAAIQAWNAARNQALPSPTPTATAGATLVAAGMKDSLQYLEFVTGSLGLLSSTYMGTDPFASTRDRMSLTGDSTSVTATMLLSYSVLASKVCADFVAKEKLLAVNNAGRLAYGPIDFTINPVLGTTVLTQANIDTVTNNLSQLLLKRDATAEEKTLMYKMVTDSVTGTTPTANDTTQLMTTACTAVASSLEAISN
jgi:hypothetical protein